MGINEKKCLYKIAIVPTAFSGAEAWDLRSAERRKVIVLEMKCLRSFVGVSRMDKVWNEEVRKESWNRKGANQRVFRWFGNVERMDELCIASVDG